MLVSVCVPGERSSGTFFCRGNARRFRDVGVSALFRGDCREFSWSGKRNRDFGDFKGFDSVPRSASPREREKARLTDEGRNAFAPKRSHEMRNKNNPMRRNAAWGGVRAKNTRLKSATAPRERRAAKTPRASGGCAFQARRMCGFSPSARFASRMGLRLFRPVGARRSRAWERCAFPRSSGAPCQKSLKLKGQSLKRSLCEQISKARETRTRLFVEFVQFVDKKSARIREICGRKICAGGISTKRLMSEAWSHAASFRAQRRRWPGRAGAAAGVAGFGAELRRR